MASPELAISKATLQATLFRADPRSLSRPEAEALFPLIDTTLSQCSRPNVQKCKNWIVDNISASSARCTALGKFFAALSKSVAAEDDGKRPSVKRRRLHLLYIINDVLFHEVVRKDNRKFGEVLIGFLPSLMGSAAAFDNCPKHKKKLQGLISLWEEKGYFSSEEIKKLQAALTNGAAENPTIDFQSSDATLKLAKDAPYILPSVHGDASSPWYDLPAATWLPHITPNSSKPMVPDQIRPIQLAAGPAEKGVADAVKSLLENVERIFSKDKQSKDDAHTDISELGERLVLDEITGEIIGGETYYGWSRQFCERMKERRKKGATAPSRGRSLSRSSSGSRSRSRSYSRGRSGSYSPPSFKRPRLSSRSQSRESSRSKTPSRERRRDRSYSRSRSRSRSRSPERRLGSSSRPHESSRSRSPLPSSTSRHHSSSRPPVPSIPFPPAPPSNDFPIPPPPPPPAGYNGQWPPPPPPMPPNMVSQQAAMPNPHLMSQMMAGWQNSGINPPPPPPPPSQHSNRYGGNGVNRGRGRGAYDHGGYRGRY